MMQSGKPKFTFELKEPGKARISFAYRDELVEFEPTNVSNAIGDLLCELMSFITNPSYLWGEETQAVVPWYDEERGINWVLTMHSEDAFNVRVTSSDGFFEDEQTELMNLDCNFRELLLSIVAELDVQIKRIGLLNYLQLWQKNEFPITYFLFLKKYLIEKGEWKPIQDRQCDVLSDELLLLLA